MRRFAPLALALVPALTACSSTPSDKGAATGQTVTQAATQVDLGITQLDAALAALEELVKKPAPDLTTQFKTYTKHLGELEKTANEVSALAAKMAERGKAYFAEWDTQIAAVQNESIRERSAERRKTVEAGLGKLQEEYGEVKGEFKPLLDNLRDIRTVLNADLTMDGLKMVKGTVEDVADDAEDVKESLQELSKSFKEIGVRLERAGPALEAVKEKQK